ncbi:MAG: hypothetical protein Ct9H90mP23_3790 [Methanobacteriota archaeon]|nr:MAG: hypothetical protein Ct9H90mP23_3790 [Euryarchaeota archaeon]
MSEEESPVDPLESWEDGAAFGVSADKDPVCKTPVEEWAEQLDIVSTEEVPIPEKLVDQVIGQEAASIIVRKAAEQRRHIIMVGEPGTGKSMLSRSMTEFLPKGKNSRIFSSIVIMRMRTNLESELFPQDEVRVLSQNVEPTQTTKRENQSHFAIHRPSGRCGLVTRHIILRRDSDIHIRVLPACFRLLFPKNSPKFW